MNFFSKRVSQFIALIVIFSFMFTSIASAAPSANQLAVQAPKQELAANIGDMPNKLPSTRVEIKDKRTEASTTFLNPDGSFTEEVYAQPMFYQDPADNQWKDIDNNLKANTAGKLQNGAGSLRVDFAPQAGSADLVTVTKNGKHISLVPVKGNSSTGTVKNNTITYLNLFPNTDAHYYVNGDSVKEDLVF